MLEVKQITPEETLELRQKILRPNQSIEECVYDSDHFRESFHLGAFKDDELISVASFLKENHREFEEMNQYRIKGMATLEEFRDHGAGSALLHDGEKILKRKHARFLWCKAKYPVSNYYRRFGLREHGEAFVIDSIGPHKLMYKIL